MGNARLVATLLLAGVACTEGPQMPPLPHSVSIVLETSGGRLLSLLVAVEPNDRGSLDVRVSEGVQLPGGGRVVVVEPVEGNWNVGGALTGRRVPLPLPAGAWSLSRVRGKHLWFAGDGGLQRCEMATASCETAPGLPPPVESESEGPEAGFRVVLDEAGIIRVLLPHQASPSGGEVVATLIRRVVSVRWLVDAPDRRTQEYLDRTFRGRSSLRAPRMAVTVDGELDEWAAIEPAVVEAPWQAEVRLGWTGARDASFSVAAAVDGENLCFAGRLRDDKILPGDAILVTLGSETTTLAVDRPPPGAVVRDEWFGKRYEACWPSPVTLADGHEPLVVSYRDADGEGLASVMASSPSRDPGATGTIIVRR